MVDTPNREEPSEDPMDSAATPHAAQTKSRRRRCSQFGLRTLLFFMTLASWGLGWLGMKVEQGRRQQAAVAAIEELGGGVIYDDQLDPQGYYASNSTPPGPAWLRALLGEDFFRNVYEITFHRSEGGLLTDAGLENLKTLTQLKILVLGETQVTDAGLEHLKSFATLEGLCLSNTKITNAGLVHLQGLTQLKELDVSLTEVTDAGLEYLKGLMQLATLDLRGTKVTATGVAKMQQSVPNCQISR